MIFEKIVDFNVYSKQSENNFTHIFERECFLKSTNTLEHNYNNHIVGIIFSLPRTKVFLWFVRYWNK